MQTEIDIRSAHELIRLAADPNVSVKASAVLASEALAILGEQVDSAEQEGGRTLVRQFKHIRQVAARIAEAVQGDDRKAQRARENLDQFAASLSDDRVLWLLASKMLTDEQRAQIQEAFR